MNSVDSTSIGPPEGNGKAHAVTQLFDHKDRFVPARAGVQLTHESSMRLGHDRRLWRYENGVYRPDGEDWARQRTRELVGERFRRNHLEEVIAFLRAQLPSLGHEPAQVYIICANGLLHWRTLTLHSHTPEVVSTNQIPVKWNPKAKQPSRFLQFVKEVVPADAGLLVDEILGYALYPGNPFQKAVMLFGPGGNGKGVLLSVIRDLLGDGNVAAVSLQKLSEDRFACTDLFGKLANICGDLDARSIQHTDAFKQITGEDAVRGEHKFKNAFSFVPYALTLVAANEWPRTADQTHAWFRRWIVLPMPNRIEGTDRADPHLKARLSDEREGILLLAVAGLQRLMERQRFTLPPSVQRAGEAYRRMIDTAKAFAVETCHLDPEGSVDRAELYREYRTWCAEGGRNPLSNVNFNARLVEMFGSRITLIKHVGRPSWRGLAMGCDLAAIDDPDSGDAGDAGDAFST
jgi:putative DNA primase/helicase